MYVLLIQVIDFERDMQQLKLGTKSEKEITYRTVLGMKKDLSGPEVLPIPGNASDSGGDSSEGKLPLNLFLLFCLLRIVLTPIRSL